MRKNNKSLGVLLLIVMATAGCNVTERMGKFPWQSDAQSDSLLSSVDPPSIHTLQSGENLQQIVDNSRGVVLIDFYADWCGPCKEQSAVLHKIAPLAESANAQIIKVNIDEHPQVAKEFQVSTLPTLVAMRDGAVSEKKVGFTRRSKVESMLR